tara:strand:+ start:569 stop:1282 length:714 start_codon:yes stop_codon:yes gene_type:complete
MIHYVYGNGESRKGFDVSSFDGVSWGCNAIYRDHKVDNLVVVDYGMQGEIVQSGYSLNNKCYFADWNILPSDDFMIEQLKSLYGKVFYYGNNQGQMVVNGSDRSKDELKNELGLHVIYANDKDLITPIEDCKEWGAGSTAVHLASKEAKEIYMFGFDISKYEDKERINNIYKGSEHYLPEYSLGTRPHAWLDQLYYTFEKFSNVTFNWVNDKFNFVDKSFPNLNLITYDNIRLHKEK